MRGCEVEPPDHGEHVGGQLLELVAAPGVPGAALSPEIEGEATVSIPQRHDLRLVHSPVEEEPVQEQDRLARTAGVLAVQVDVPHPQVRPSHVRNSGRCHGMLRFEL